jgi:NMT1/THI5-like protein
VKSKEFALYSRREKKMKKKFVIAGLVLGMAVAVSACGAKSETKESTTAAASQEEGTKAAESKAEASSEKAEADIKTGDKPESATITFAQGNSGNVLVSIARAQGYFDEVGLTVNEIPLDDGQMQAVSSGQVDIASNSGTWTPVKMIAAGDDMAIIGGNMLTGCMPVIAKEGTEYKGPESFLGKRVGDTVSRYALFHTLEEQGHDIAKEITFVDGMSDEDEIQAVLKGELDFATIGTGRMYQVLNTKGIKIVTYCSDETPNYSCCRMVARDSWVKKNPTTVKLLNEALIRAQAYFTTHKAETVDLMVKQLGANKEYVEAYLLNEHYRINPDTLKNTVLDNYKYMESVNGIENKDNSVNLADRIYDQLYKEALDEAQKKWGSENPEFYEEAQKFFTEHNT